MAKNTLKIGWFSIKQENNCGVHYEYKTPTHEHVLVTEVTDGYTYTSKFPDVVCVGPVTKFIQRVVFKASQHCDLHFRDIFINYAWLNNFSAVVYALKSSMNKMKIALHNALFGIECSNAIRTNKYNKPESNNNNSKNYRIPQSKKSQKQKFAGFPHTTRRQTIQQSKNTMKIQKQRK